MRLFHIIIVAILVLIPSVAESQTDSWWTYISDYNGLPGSVRVDMGIYPEAPISEYPFIIITGIQYEAHEDGMPLIEHINDLNSLQEKVVEALADAFDSIYVGTFSYDGEQLHYVYVKDIEGVQSTLDSFYEDNCAHCKVYTNIKHDPFWKSYREFLYPNKATMDFYEVEFNSPEKEAQDQ